MKILIVASGNSNSISPFILDQTNALKKQKIKIGFFMIKGNGVFGYLKNYKSLTQKIKNFTPDLIHAHYGLSGFLSVLQRKIPTVITFHGSDINIIKVRYFSIIANKLSAKSIFVSIYLANKLNQKKPIVIPCGVDLDLFYPIDKKKARIKLGLSLDRKYILFSSSFSNIVKNYALAKKAIERVQVERIQLVELKGFQRSEVALLMNAVDAVLLTSFTEGSPQFIKEAMACNTPIVSVDVGDVRDIIRKTKGCYIAKRDHKDIAFKIQEVLVKNERTRGRNNIEHLDNRLIANKIIDVYNLVLEK